MQKFLSLFASFKFSSTLWIATDAKALVIVQNKRQIQLSSEKKKGRILSSIRNFLNSRSYTAIWSLLIHQIKSFKMIGVILTLLIQVRSVGQGSRLWPNCFLTNCWFLLSAHSNCLPFDLINEVGFQCLSQKSSASTFVST